MVKCEICNNEIEETFLGKTAGAIVKIKKDNKNQLIHVCSTCQKKHKNNINKELEKLEN